MDTSSSELHGDSVHLDGRLIVEDTKKASDIVDGIGNTPAGYEGAHSGVRRFLGTGSIAST